MKTGKVTNYIKQFNIIHDNKYTYDRKSFLTTRSKISIICPDHGLFTISLYRHILGEGCPECGNGKDKLDLFIKRSKEIFPEGLKYENLVYENFYSPVKLNCILHGEFEINPTDHIINHKGCPVCEKTSKGELIVEKYLVLNSIKYSPQHTFNDCKNVDKLRFDFYLPDHNIIIEYDGQQHHKSVRKFGGKTKLIYVKNNDKIKNDYCVRNNIKLIRINYNDDILLKLNDLFDLKCDFNTCVTDFDKTINKINEYMRDIDDIKLSDLVRNIHHHYKTDSSANSAIRKYINRGVINGYTTYKRDNSIYIKKI